MPAETGLDPDEAILADHPAARIKLIRAREKLRLSRPELAQEIGVARTHIWNVELGYRNPRLKMMQRWLKVLGAKASLDLFKQNVA